MTNAYIIKAINALAELRIAHHKLRKNRNELDVQLLIGQEEMDKNLKVIKDQMMNSNMADMYVQMKSGLVKLSYTDVEGVEIISINPHIIEK